MSAAAEHGVPPTRQRPLRRQKTTGECASAAAAFLQLPSSISTGHEGEGLGGTPCAELAGCDAGALIDPFGSQASHLRTESHIAAQTAARQLSAACASGSPALASVV